MIVGKVASASGLKPLREEKHIDSKTIIDSDLVILEYLKSTTDSSKLLI